VKEGMKCKIKEGNRKLNRDKEKWWWHDWSTGKFPHTGSDRIMCH